MGRWAGAGALLGGFGCFLASGPVLTKPWGGRGTFLFPWGKLCWRGQVA